METLPLERNHHVAPSMSLGTVSVRRSASVAVAGAHDATAGSLHGPNGRICVRAAPQRHITHARGVESADALR